LSDTKNELESWFGGVDEATVPLKELERLLADGYRNPAKALTHSWETSSHLVLLGGRWQAHCFYVGAL
jgi:hypothetical protein